MQLTTARLSLINPHTMGEEPNKHQTFRLGDTVRIRSGPFVSFTGKIEGINQSKELLLVKVAIYGRSEPITLNFVDVEFGNIHR